MDFAKEFMNDPLANLSETDIFNIRFAFLIRREFEMPRIPLDTHISEQRKWIAEHGGNLHGYILRYGSAKDPDHYGEGGEAIFQADLDHLETLLEKKRKGRKYL